MAWRCTEPLDSLIIDDNQSQFDFIMGQEKEIIDELVLNGPKCNGAGRILGVRESISPSPLLHLFESSIKLYKVSK